MKTESRFTVVLPDDLRNELERLAGLNERKAGEELRLALRNHIAASTRADGGLVANGIARTRAVS